VTLSVPYMLSLADQSYISEHVLRELKVFMHATSPKAVTAHKSHTQQARKWYHLNPLYTPLC
jgi:hypothetical protein